MYCEQRICYQPGSAVLPLKQQKFTSLRCKSSGAAHSVSLDLGVLTVRQGWRTVSVSIYLPVASVYVVFSVLQYLFLGRPSASRYGQSRGASSDCCTDVPPLCDQTLPKL